MKLQDIATRTLRQNPEIKPAIGARDCDDYSTKRIAEHPEIAMLLDAHKRNELSNCSAMALDEVELAYFIINKLDCDPLYIPSMTLLAAIRSVNAKLALGQQ